MEAKQGKELRKKLNDKIANQEMGTGAVGGMSVFKNSSSNSEDNQEFLHSDNESTTDDSIKRACEEREARALREENSDEEISKEITVDIMKRMKEAAQKNITT